MSKHLNAAVFAALLLIGTAHAAVEVNGDILQSAELKNSPTSALAIGPGARAEAGVNTVEGDVKVKGSVRQTAILNNSPTSALAIGPGAVATANVNKVAGK